MRRRADIDFGRCRPKECGGGAGCPAARACAHRLLEQEGEGEPPMLLSASMCVGCGRCAQACPLEAVRVVGG